MLWSDEARLKVGRWINKVILELGPLGAGKTEATELADEDGSNGNAPSQLLSLPLLDRHTGTFVLVKLSFT